MEVLEPPMCLKVDLAPLLVSPVMQAGGEGCAVADAH